jgi:Holliday junction resolvase
MQSTTKPTEIKHYLMISALIDQLRKGGYTEIEADHIMNAVRPGEILGEDGALTPDVVASKNGRKVYFEVKTEEDLFSPRTEEQIRTFLRYAEETGGEFCLLVPARCCFRVKYLLDSLHLPETTVLYI